MPCVLHHVGIGHMRCCVSASTLLSRAHARTHARGQSAVHHANVLVPSGKRREGHKRRRLDDEEDEE